ncbi:MAG: squalene/phytoene synthase family protein [Paracoccus sp. (in: a-proteobacteria)]|nr:squalene/phytoene synthase family protein [Paracoccus sp. (in: a-proteobacteria)]
MSLDACAALLRDGDPDRLAVVMAAAPAYRPRLVSLYAANLEIARAALASSEPLISLMRLQWWQDQLAGIAAGKGSPGHEVLDAVAAHWGVEAGAIGALAEARRHDAMREPLRDEAAVLAYIDATAGALMRLAAGVCGYHGAAVADQARGAGLAAWLAALPRLAGLGLGVEDAPARIAGLAEEGIAGLDRAARHRDVPKKAAPALFAGAGARVVLRAAAQGQSVEISQFSRRFALLRLALFGHWRG